MTSASPHVTTNSNIATRRNAQIYRLPVAIHDLASGEITIDLSYDQNPPLLRALGRVRGGRSVAPLIWLFDRSAVDPALREVVRHAENYAFGELGAPADYESLDGPMDGGAA